ncbi:DNA binding protein [Arthrobacter phage VroomVroom]|uniref:DNA binding protein n=1 Tax=Arthrobacter phage VroomVroom TaxID=3049371 RepID=A0AA49F9U1_9CAUD|nr:DNA binding protein [Arthrobacter phage VroomVroom]
MGNAGILAVSMNMTTNHTPDAVRTIFYKRLDLPAITVEQENDLIASAQAGEETSKLAVLYYYAPAMRGAVIRALHPLGHSATQEHREEAQSLALLGILEALAKHDTSRGTRLAATAKYTLRDAYAEIDWAGTSPFAIPEKTLRRFYALMAEADQDIDVALEISHKHSLQPETAMALYRALRLAGSYDGLSSGGEDMDDTLTYASPLTMDDRLDAIIESEERLMVAEALEALTPDEERAIRLLFGFETDEELSETAAGKAMGTSRKIVRKLKASAMPKMREALGVESPALPTEKSCVKCQETKPVEEFHANQAGVPEAGYRATCKACVKAARLAA